MGDGYPAILLKFIQVAPFLIVLKAAHLYMYPDASVTHKTLEDTVRARHETTPGPIEVENTPEPKPPARLVVDGFSLWFQVSCCVARVVRRNGFSTPGSMRLNMINPRDSWYDDAWDPSQVEVCGSLWTFVNCIYLLGWT